MSTLRPEIHRLYENISSRLTNRIESIHSSIRLFGHSCVDSLNRLHNNSNTLASNNIINNDVESSANSNGNTEANHNSTSQNSSSDCLENSNTPPRHSNHRRSLRRDHQFRNSYRHSYPHGLVSIRTLEKDRNVLAAILSIVVIAILATALAQFKWFSIYNDLCDSHFYNKAEPSEKDANTNDEIILGLHAPSLGQQSYMYAKSAQSYSLYSTASPVTIYEFAPSYKFGCATPQILALKRTIVGLCFLSIMCSMIQFFMDIMGTKRKWVNSMRAHAVGNIVTVLLCVLIIGLCYFVSILYERVQLHQLFRKLRPAPTGIFIKHSMMKPQVDKSQLDILTVHQVKFELSYYLVTLAGFLSILAAAANLFRRPRQIFIERISHSRHRNRLNGDESSLLGSDLLNSESSSYFPFYHPNSWIFNSNWNSFYNTNSVNSNGNNSTRQTSVAFAPQVSNCPPPPPYTP